MARWQDEIPADQAAAEAAGQALEAAEAQLEELQDGIKDEVEAHHQALNKVGVVGSCCHVCKPLQAVPAALGCCNCDATLASGFQLRRGCHD
jgi:hypothetical protein